MFVPDDDYQLSNDFHITVSSVSLEKYEVMQWRDVNAVGGGSYFSSHGNKSVYCDEWNKNWPSWEQKTNTRKIVTSSNPVSYWGTSYKCNCNDFPVISSNKVCGLLVWAR